MSSPIYFAATDEELRRIVERAEADRAPALFPATDAELRRILAKAAA